MLAPCVLSEMLLVDNLIQNSCRSRGAGTRLQPRSCPPARGHRAGGRTFIGLRAPVPHCPVAGVGLWIPATSCKGCPPPPVFYKPWGAAYLFTGGTARSRGITVP